ncbi:hypothetical protein KIF59_21660 [Enterobacter cloacae subsp. cloacae]|nr:hypothetical protein [Enterobacter cloacae subsp. cloacae]
MPELPELVYDSLRQSKNLQLSMDKNRPRASVEPRTPGQSLLFVWHCATLLLSGTLLLIKPSGLADDARLGLMAAGIVVWFVG